MAKPVEETAWPSLWHKEWPSEQKIEKTAVTNDALEMINRLTPEPVTQEQVWTGRMKLANDQLDRSEEKFPVSYLKRFAETLPGKSVMLAHNYYSGPPVGRFYDAEVRKDADGHHLLASFFMDSDGQHTAAVRKGIAGHVSIGFQGDTRMCDICGKDYDGWYKRAPAQADDDPCSHVKGRMYDGVKATVTWGGDVQKAEAQEGSFVWLGCQRGAEMTRAATMDITQKAAHFDTLVATAADGKGKKMEEKEKAEFAEREKALTAEIERLKPLAADGEAYRKYQKSEIARLHSSMGEEATGAALLKALDGADATALDGVRKDADARHAKAFARGGAEVGGDDGPMNAQHGTTPKRSLDEILFGARGGG